MERRDIQSSQGFYFIIINFLINSLFVCILCSTNNESVSDGAARILVEFLEVAITSIVFLKGVYPAGLLLIPFRFTPFSLFDCFENFVAFYICFVDWDSRKENPFTQLKLSEKFHMWVTELWAIIGFSFSLCLMMRSVLVEGAFERRRYMNLVVQRARHPELRDYINSAVSGLLPFMQKVFHFYFIYNYYFYSSCV